MRLLNLRSFAPAIGLAGWLLGAGNLLAQFNNNNYQQQQQMYQQQQQQQQAQQRMYQQIQQQQQEQQRYQNQQREYGEPQRRAYQYNEQQKQQRENYDRQQRQFQDSQRRNEETQRQSQQQYEQFRQQQIQQDQWRQQEQQRQDAWRRQMDDANRRSQTSYYSAPAPGPSDDRGEAAAPPSATAERWRAAERALDTKLAASPLAERGALDRFDDITRERQAAGNATDIGARFDKAIALRHSR